MQGGSTRPASEINKIFSYRSTKNLSLAAVGLLAGMALLNALNTLFSFLQLYFPYQNIELDSGESVPFWVIAIAFTAVMEFPVYVLTVVFFLMWLNRSYKNLTPLGAQDLAYSSGWAVGYWFIPFVNLVRPFQVVREIWNKSDPDHLTPGLRFSLSKSVPLILVLWWALWLLSNIADNLSMRLDMTGKDENAAVATAVYGVANLLAVWAAITAIMMVNGITRRQTERYEKIAQAQLLSDPPSPDF